MSLEETPDKDSVENNDISYSLKLTELPSDIQLDLLIIEFLKKFKLSNSDIELIRSTNDSEINYNFIKFFKSELNLNNFLEFFDQKFNYKLNYELILNDYDLNLQLPGHLYIRGLLPTTTAQNLYNIFKTFGEIKTCKIIFNDFGISKGFGFINFKNRNQSINAINRLNGCNVDGNNLFINHHISKKDRLKELQYKKSSFSNIYIKNLPLNFEKSKLFDLFTKFGEIISIFLPQIDNNPINNNNDEINGEFAVKGYGFINFKYHDDAMKAKSEMNNYQIDADHIIQIDRAERKKEKFQYENLNNHFNSNNKKFNNDDESHNFDKFSTTNPNHDRNYSFSSASSSHSRRTSIISYNNSPSMIQQPSTLPIFNQLSNNLSNSSLNSNQIYQQPIMPFTFNQKNKSQELLLNPIERQPNLNNINSNMNLNSNSSSIIPPFIVSPDSNLISTTTGLPIAGPNFQDSNLYVTHIPLDYKDEDLFALFEPCGNITSAKIITYQPDEIYDKEELNSKSNEIENEIEDGSENGDGNGADADNDDDDDDDDDVEINTNSNSDSKIGIGLSKGFGFVCFHNPIDASKALITMNGYRLDSKHTLNVSFAQRKENKYTQGKLHHYNQNHLGNLYQYINNSMQQRMPVNHLPMAPPVGSIQMNVDNQGYAYMPGWYYPWNYSQQQQHQHQHQQQHQQHQQPQHQPTHQHQHQPQQQFENSYDNQFQNYSQSIPPLPLTDQYLSQSNQQQFQGQNFSPYSINNPSAANIMYGHQRARSSMSPSPIQDYSNQGHRKNIRYRSRNSQTANTSAGNVVSNINNVNSVSVNSVNNVSSASNVNSVNVNNVNNANMNI